MRIALLIGLLAAGWTAQAQTFVTTQPDCIVFFGFTAAGQTSPTSPNAGLDNRTLGCNTWNLSYVNSGFGTLSIQLESAANNNGAPASYSAGFPVQQTVLAGANPASNTTGGFLWIVGFNAWVRVRLVSVTSTGVVNGALYGWRIPSAGAGPTATQNVDIVAPLGQTTMAASIPVVVASNQTNLPTNVAAWNGHTAAEAGLNGAPAVGGGAAAGSAPTTNPVPVGYLNSAGNLATPDYCTLKAFINNPTSGSTQLVAVSGGTTIRVCDFWFAGDALTTVKLVTGTGSTCTSPTDETGTFSGSGGGLFGLFLDPPAPLVTTAAKTLCANFSAGFNGTAMVTYSQR